MAMVSTTREALHRLQARAKKVREDSKHATAQITNSAAAAGSAFGISYLEAAYPEGIGKGVFGIDTSLLIGIVGVGVGATGMVSDRMSSDLIEAMGIGALSAYAAKKGREKGAESLTK